MPRAQPVAAPNPHGAALDLLREQSLTSLVQRELERRIEAGELAPGAKLNEVDVAADLRVSRGPVREAFRALEQAGLVRTEKNRGVSVRQVSLQEADEIYEVRAALEALIGQLSTEEHLFGLGMQLFWIVALTLVVIVGWKFAVKRFSSVGG